MYCINNWTKKGQCNTQLKEKCKHADWLLLFSYQSPSVLNYMPCQSIKCTKQRTLIYVYQYDDGIIIW